MSRDEDQTSRIEKLFSADKPAPSGPGADENGEKKMKRERRFRLRSKLGITLLIALVAVLVVATLTVIFLVRANERPAPDPVAVTVPVALSGVKTPNDTKIGVVLTLGAGTTEGSEWGQAAQGAVVAQQRLALGGTEIELIVEDDFGTGSGAEDAVLSLIEQGVSGIVYASSGPHLEAGLAAAAEAEIPVVLPYTAVPQGAAGVWSLALDETSISEALTRALADFDRPLHVNAGDGLPAAVAVSDEIRFNASTETAQFAADVARRTGIDPLAGGAYAGGQATDGEDAEPPVENPVDVVIVSGHPVLQASVVYALQSRNVSVPIMLTPQAVSPLFDVTLAQQGGAVSPSLRTVGAAWDDAEALSTVGQGRAMSAYLAAIRQLADDKSVMNLTDDAPFAEAASAADVRSHDAVLALAEAISSASSTDPTKVRNALGQLRLVAGNGIAGPELDFTRAQALDGDVTVLYATAQQLGLRPQTGERPDGLVWITEPIQR